MMIEITALAVLVTTIMSTLLSHGFEVLVALITRMPERVGACASSIISLLDVFDDGKQHSMKIYRSWIEHLPDFSYACVQRPLQHGCGTYYACSDDCHVAIGASEQQWALIEMQYFC